MRRWILALGGAGLCILIPSLLAAQPSKLWGTDGEAWSPTSRLPDFSHAGYAEGKTAIPDFPVQANVKNFGATGDGVTDDTEAFLKAIQSVHEGAVWIPAGRYVLTRQLKISKAHFALRGEGRDRTTLLFTKSLTDLFGARPEWSWSGGLIDFSGYDGGPVAATVTAPAKRGDKSVVVSSRDSLSVGQFVRLSMTNTDGSLGRHLYAGQKDAAAELKTLKLVDFPAHVAAIDGNRVTLDRPLRVDVRLEWQPAILSAQPSTRDVGIEDLTLSFPERPAQTHHKEVGFNAIEFQGVTDGWARRLKIINADSGIFLLLNTRFCTVDDVIFMAAPARLRKGYGGPGEPTDIPVAGHHGILAGGLSQDNLIKNFHFAVRFIHDLSVSAYSTGNVFSSGDGIDVSIDHHRRAPYENLFTQIDLGDGDRLWETGGDLTDGPPGGARETYWNIKSKHPQTLPAWPVQMNVIGMTGSAASALSPTENWWEAIAPAALRPENLYDAQHAGHEIK